MPNLSPTASRLMRAHPGDHGEPGLPEYANQLTAFHRAFAHNLKAAVDIIPLEAGATVMDVGCGDGFYLGLLAERVRDAGTVIGLDSNHEYLKVAKAQPAVVHASCDVHLFAGRLDRLPVPEGTCDLVWTAQTLYSLPDPVDSLRQMARAVRPGGLVAVLENDTLHQAILPWPNDLEIALRAAEFAALCDESPRPGKYYIGWRLPSVFAQAGLEPLGFRSQCIDRSSPVSPELEQFLQDDLGRLSERAKGRLGADEARKLANFTDPESDEYLPRQPYFTMSWLNVLAWGRRPVA